jgi:branched-chain amino acid transport system substrate-binding protein
MTMKSLLSTVSLALLLGGAATAAQAQIAIGHLADYSGGTSDVGTPYGQAVADTFAWVNKNGGVAGKQLKVDTNDYGYQVPRAIALYKKWSGSDKVAAIMGWGTADTEALTGFLAQDKIPDISGSYAAALTDPEGTSGKTKPAPYNFFYGPSYSDAMRAMLTWAAEDVIALSVAGSTMQRYQRRQELR